MSLPAPRLPSFGAACKLSLVGVLASATPVEGRSLHLDLAGTLRTALAARYLVDEEIGRGGMAVVCRARDLRTDREVAIKVLYPDLARAVAGDRFMREIGILSQLSHPNILPLLDSGTVEVQPGLAVPWYAMPLAAGETLRARLEREGALPLPVALSLTRDVCAALAHAHQQGVIHRDVKPENILLHDGRAVVADFGIARAITLAGGGQLSSTGIVVGTPAYMSPEQSAGSERLDGRSDLYSLGIVLYEMLAGHPPFTGSTPQAVAARHQFEPPPPITVVRPGLPPAVVAVVERALAKVPADRFADAEALSAAVARAPTHLVAAARQPPWRRWWPVAAGVVLLLLGGWALGSRLLGGAAADPNRFVVLPFEVQGRGTGALLNGDEAASLVTDALTRWTDFGMVSGLTVGSALAAERESLTVRRAAALARGLGAGHLIWGEIARDGEQLRITGVLYDTRTGREVLSRTVRLVPEGLDPGTLALRFAELTYQLTLPGQPTPADAAEALGAKSTDAWRLYATGDSALNAWNLPLAERKYGEALALDPEYPNANLKLAQVGNWLDRPVAAWRGNALRALAARERLTRPQRLVAEGLVALADSAYPVACGKYRELLALDSLDFRGWFGLGECQARDDIVLADSASPTGMRFRSSYEGALRSYTRALTLVPSTHLAYSGAALRQLRSRLKVEPGDVRGGRGPGDAAQSWFGYPELRGDTVAFVPHAMRALNDGSAIPPTFAAALAANRERYIGITSEWVRRFPGSRSARLAQVEALELAGRIDGPDTSMAALPALSRIRREGSATDLDLLLRQVRLLFKAGRDSAARAAAETALALPPGSPEEGVALAGAAALVGMADRAVELYGAYGGREFAAANGEGFVTVPEAVAREANRLLIYAAFGEPAESLSSIMARLRRVVNESVSLGERELALHSVTYQARLLAFPALGVPEGPSYSLSDAAKAISRGDRPGALQALGALQRAQPEVLLPLISPDFAQLEARLWALAGDTAMSRQRLSVITRSRAWLGLALLEQPTEAAAAWRAR